jgi:hypothetical protein
VQCIKTSCVQVTLKQEGLLGKVSLHQRLSPEHLPVRREGAENWHNESTVPDTAGV